MSCADVCIDMGYDVAENEFYSEIALDTARGTGVGFDLFILATVRG